MNLLSFPKMLNLYNLDMDEGIWLCDYVGIQEKMHGTQTRVGISKEDIIIGSRRRELTRYNPGQIDQFDMCIEIASDLHERLLKQTKLLDFSDVMLFGEFAGPRIQKGIDYGEDRGLYIFDVVLINKESEERNWLDVTEVEMFCQKWGLPMVPLLMHDAIPSMEVFNFLYDLPSQIIREPGNIVEGIVIKSRPVIFDAYGHPVYAKHKNSRWGEKIERAPKARSQMVQYVTKARVIHAVERLKEDGLFTRHMQDMKYLADIITKDIMEEENVTGEYKDNRRAVSKLAARIYKELLLRGEV